MRERETRKEIVGKGELMFLAHPGSDQTFSGYGLPARPGSPDLLVGLLMIDRPGPADQQWLEQVESAFGECDLVPMTATGERGIACQMQIEPCSLPHLRSIPSEKAAAIASALEPLADNPPRPVFTLHWDNESRMWRSRLAASPELPGELRDLFRRFGHGCLAAETNAGVVHVCHTTDTNIDGFEGKPVVYQWQLVKMPTAPLIRLDLVILDQPATPYKFESFLNVADDAQARILAQLANQDLLQLAFYGDDLTYRFTKTITHDQQHWQCIDELVSEASRHWSAIPPELRDFDRAKAEFMEHFV